jgi:NAD(P)-dependent dehydrogenase (short-subunit alcohol dehydrogenase family)
LTDRLLSVLPNPDDREAAARSIPLRRLGNPEEFGRVAAFMLSPAASYLTGLVLPGRRWCLALVVSGHDAEIIKNSHPCWLYEPRHPLAFDLPT